MPAASQKVGKSLLKFLKPVQIVSSTGPGSSKQEQTKGFRLLQFKKAKPTETIVKTETQKVTPKVGASGLPATQDIVPPKQGANWVETVSYIIALCKRTSLKITSKVAVPTYQRVMNSKIQQKIKFIGSIINTNVDEAEEKFYVKRLQLEAELEKRREKVRLQLEQEEKEIEARKKKEKDAA